MLAKTLTLLSFLAPAAIAAAVPSSSSSIFLRQANVFTGDESRAVDILLQIAPKSSCCENAPAPGECATAQHAAPFLIKAMNDYSVTNVNEIAMMLSLIALESGEFKYNVNHFPAPGHPGQGTRNMQSANFNLQYALSIPELAPRVRAITASDSTAGLTDAQLNAVRALVLPDEYSWASAAWFLTTNCASVRSQIQQGGDAGLAAYLGPNCINTPVTPDRTAYLTKARAALGISQGA